MRKDWKARVAVFGFAARGEIAYICRMPTRNLNGVTFYYEDRGNGPPVVLVHAFPVDSRMWESQLSDLSSHWRVIAPDLRGFGRSTASDPLTIESMAADLHALLGEIGALPCVLGGISMGGYIGLAYALKYATDLRALILIDTKAEADNSEQKEARMANARLARAEGAKAIAEKMLPKMLADETPHRRPAVSAALRKLMEQCPPATIEHALLAMRDRPDQSANLSSIPVPALVIVGENDSITPIAAAQSMQNRIPNAQLAVIRGAGHMSPMEQPAQVNRAIRQFLQGNCM
jgi:pimeloyl-ACP methyl ester carboxylesterase